jgi:hypothetical protein
MNRITFDPSEGPTSDQQAAETAALEQGEKLIQAQQEDKDRLYEQADAANEEVSLIGGKFKSQDDLLKAYNELQSKLGKPKDDNDDESEDEGLQAEGEREEEEVLEDKGEVTENVRKFVEISDRFDKNGGVSDEDFDSLSQMSSKDLLDTYFKYHATQVAKAKQTAATNDQLASIRNSVGGDEAYNSMIEWAGSNLTEAETNQFNDVVNSNNAAAISFAVEALNNRFRNQEGYEAPLVTGKKASNSKKVFRSQAELSRAIADPRYSSDPAYRMDVEEKLARSGDLL